MEAAQKKRRLNSEINVVPYIDVMLVLLIIFMITAPLLTTGVEVDLPSAEADPLDILGENSNKLLTLTVDKEGNLYLSNGSESSDDPQDVQTVRLQAAAALRRNPQLPVFVRADETVPYGKVVEAMVLLQAAGASKIGMMTDPPE